MTTIDETLAERGKRYGEFASHARITQNIKRAMQDSENWLRLDDDMREALEMLAHKVGRILNGDPTYDDSWRDAAGYCALVEKRLSRGSAVTSDGKTRTEPYQTGGALDWEPGLPEPGDRALVDAIGRFVAVMDEPAKLNGEVIAGGVGR